MQAGAGFRRGLTVAILSAACLVAVLVPAVAVAAKAPSLASTAQYKAFIAYVKKLDGIAGQPRSASLKATFEAELGTKKEAASHKANALFSRSSEEARAEANEKSKEQSAAVRRHEEEDLEALAAEYASKLDRAKAGYQAKYERIVTGHENFEAGVHAQIAKLRSQKAKSANVAKKAQIQGRIEAQAAKLAANRQDGVEKRQALKAAYDKQKGELHAAEAAAETEIGETAEATVVKIAKHWKKVFVEKKAALNSKRESQLAYLLGKLEKGRADIASMPSTG